MKAAGVVDDDDERPGALQVELSIRLCLLTCDTNTQSPDAAAVADDDN